MPNTHLTLTQLQAVLKVFEIYDVALVDYMTLKGISPETFIQIVEEIQEVLTEEKIK